MILYRGELEAVSSGLCFGIAPIFMKYGFLAGVDIFYGIAIAAGTGLLLNLIIHTKTKFWRGLFSIMPKIFFFIIMGGIVNTIAMFSFYGAVASGEVSVIVPITCTYPLFTLFFSYLFVADREEINKRIISGTIFIIIGVILTV